MSVNLPPEFGFPPIQANFLDGLIQALALRGLSYHTVSNLNFQFSLLGGGIGLVDRDVILVSSYLTLARPGERHLLLSPTLHPRIRPGNAHAGLGARYHQNRQPDGDLRQHPS